MDKAEIQSECPDDFRCHAIVSSGSLFMDFPFSLGAASVVVVGGVVPYGWICAIVAATLSKFMGVCRLSILEVSLSL